MSFRTHFFAITTKKQTPAGRHQCLQKQKNKYICSTILGANDKFRGQVPTRNRDKKRKN